MPLPTLSLGGVPFVLHSGAPELSSDELRGSAITRMSGGLGVQMTHWSGKLTGTIAGQGWMPPGLDGLDYSQPLELLSTQQQSVTGSSNAVALKTEPRPDHAPWALALVNGEWVSTPCAYAAGVATATPVAGATLYSIAWFPRLMVFATPVQQSVSTGNLQTPHGWSLTWEEV